MSAKPKKSKKRRKVVQRFKARISELGLTDKSRLIYHPKGELKMSEVLMDFVEPYWVSARTEEDYRRLLSVALVAWNAALLPAKKRQEMVDQIIQKAMPFAADDARLVIDELIGRKDRYFAEIRRGILAYELTMTKQGPHVSVASTL